MRKRECPCVALEMDGNACDGCGNFKGPEAESGLHFEKDGVTFRAWRGMARAERDGKLLWSAMDVFTKSPPTEKAVLAFHKAVTESWHLREESENGEAAKNNL